MSRKPDPKHDSGVRPIVRPPPDPLYREEAKAAHQEAREWMKKRDTEFPPPPVEEPRKKAAGTR